MSAFQTVLHDIADGVATVALNRPERRNALTPELMGEIRQAVDLSVTAGARVLVMRGEGEGFCSGADLLDDDGSGPPADCGLPLEEHYNPLIRALNAAPIPIVARVHGVAAGAGCALALAADFVIAARSSSFILAFARIGLVPDAGTTWILPRLIGQARALEMAILGDRIPADKAESWGLIYSAVDDADLDTAIDALAARLATGPTVAIGLIRSAIRSAQSCGFEEGLALECRNQAIAGDTADFAEGLAAFRERRSARFTGR